MVCRPFGANSLDRLFTGLRPVLWYAAPSGLIRWIVFVHRASPCAMICRPFGAKFVGSFLFTGLRPVLCYAAPSGLVRWIVFVHRASPCAMICRPFGAKFVVW